MSDINIATVMLSNDIYLRDSDFSAKLKSCIDRIPVKNKRVCLCHVYRKASGGELQASKYLPH